MTRPAAFERFRSELEAELEKHGGDGKSPFYDMLRYHMGWIDEMRIPRGSVSGDRLYGTLCLLAAEAGGADYRTALPAAAGVEMAHGFSMIHEELRLGSPTRGDRPALWWVWGHAQGINAGDGMYALARLAVMDLERQGVPPEVAVRAAATLDRYCLELCEHQFMEIEMQQRPQAGVQERLQVIRGTDGALMACAAELGVLSASVAEEELRAFADFGRKVGVAFRIRRDADALWGMTPGGKSHVIGILDYKRSLPVLYAMKTAESATRDLMAAVATRARAIEDKDIGELLEAFERAGARRFAEEAIEQHLNEGLKALGGSGARSSAVAELEGMARYLAEPEA